MLPSDCPSMGDLSRGVDALLRTRALGRALAGLPEPGPVPKRTGPAAGGVGAAMRVKHVLSHAGAHSPTHPHTPNARTHTHARTRTHAREHTHTHTRTFQAHSQVHTSTPSSLPPSLLPSLPPSLSSSLPKLVGACVAATQPGHQCPSHRAPSVEASVGRTCARHGLTRLSLCAPLP